MSERPDREAFVKRVTDAAEQLWLMRPWDLDQKLKTEGWTTFYAVDADVVTTYGSPRSNARRSGHRLGYAEVFSDDPPEGSYALAERLTDHVFFSLQPEVPLIIIPPIDSEIRSIFEALTARLSGEPEKLTVGDDLRESVAKLIGADKREIPTDVLEKFSVLLSLRGDSPQIEYRRLTFLVQKRRIMPSHMIGREDSFPDHVREVVAAPSTLAEIYDHAVLSDQWLNRIAPIWPENKRLRNRRERLTWDAYALARLELWNNKLREKRTRIVYITGSLHVLAASAKYVIEGNDIDFLTRYIRHPRYFLALPEVVVEAQKPPSFGSPAAASSQFFNWIVTFLTDCRVNASSSNIGKGSFDVEGHVIDAAKAAFEQDPELGLDLREKWHAYLGKLPSAYVPPDMILDQIKEDLQYLKDKRALDRWRELRSKLDERIEAERDRAWEACFRTATRTGFFVAYAGASPIRGEFPSRLVPPLRFDRWPDTDAFVRAMGAWRKPEDLSVKAYEVGLESVKNETKESYSYAYYLAHAALFAARGDWRIGAILAIRALAKAPHKVPGPSTTGHGREASYLAAYCLRHCARSNAEIDDAKRYLDIARDLYTKEKLQHPHLEALPERFDAEYLAFDMVRLMRAYYAAGKEQAPSPDDWARLRQDYECLRQQVKVWPSTQMSSDDARRYSVCAIRLRSQLSANICMISIMMDDCETESFRGAGKELSEYLRSSQSNQSYYLKTLELFWLAATKTRMVTRKEADRWFDPRRIEAHAVLPYDRERFREIGEKLKLLTRR